jgi:hypothetical protein
MGAQQSQGIFAPKQAPSLFDGFKNLSNGIARYKNDPRTLAERAK